MKRGGPHLGSIIITQAQIGRQNRPVDSADDRDFRHAFLIIETARKGGSIRHVLCAESDMERDSWIEMLVRHVDPETTQQLAPPPPATSTPPALLSGLMRKRSQSRKLGKDVGNAPPPAPPAQASGLFGRAISPQLDNRSPSTMGSPDEADLAIVRVETPPIPTISMNDEPSDSDMPRPNGQPVKRSSFMPPSKQVITPAYLTQLSSSGLSAPLGSERERKAKSGRFWNAFTRSTPAVSKPVFAVPLEISLAISSIAGLPSIVFRCVEWLEAHHAEDEEGIYRLSGSSAVIKGLKDRFDDKGDVNLVAPSVDEQWDPHAIAGLLKTYLRDLPTSLLTHELHPEFLSVMGETSTPPLSHPALTCRSD